MPQSFENPNQKEIYALLARINTIAVVGLSPKPYRPSHYVAAALQRFGYRIIPVRPATAEVLGEIAYPDLYQTPSPIDLVDVFRAPEHVGPIVDACIARKFSALWLQDDVINHEAARRAQEAGIRVIMDRCIYRDYAAFAAAGRPPRG